MICSLMRFFLEHYDLDSQRNEAFEEEEGRERDLPKNEAPEMRFHGSGPRSVPFFMVPQPPQGKRREGPGSSLLEVIPSVFGEGVLPAAHAEQGQVARRVPSLPMRSLQPLEEALVQGHFGDEDAAGFACRSI